MKQRKKCSYCKQPLIAFQGHYLHPENPCNGNSDALDVTAKIEDDFLVLPLIGITKKKEKP